MKAVFLFLCLELISFFPFMLSGYLLAQILMMVVAVFLTEEEERKNPASNDQGYDDDYQ